MKIGSFHGLFWGTALIIVGGGLMMQHYFQFDFPWLRVVAAFALIYAGLLLIFRPKFLSDDAFTILFGKGQVNYDVNQKEYKVIFGDGTIRFDNLDVQFNQSVEINGIFSEVKILLPKEGNYTVKSDAAFASFINPDGNTVSFGSMRYQPPWFDPQKPHLKIKANIVFGSMRTYLV